MARWYTQFLPVQKTTQRWHVFHQRNLKQSRAEHWTNNQADQIKKPVISELSQYIHQLLVCFKYADRFHWPQLGMTIICATFDVHELISASIFSHSNSASKTTESWNDVDGSDDFKSSDSSSVEKCHHFESQEKWESLGAFVVYKMWILFPSQNAFKTPHTHTYI